MKTNPSPAPRLPEMVVWNRQRAVPLDLPWLRRFAEEALPLCAETSADSLFALRSLEEVVITVVSDRKIAAIHQEFMGIPGATDVITFQHGEIIVSAETALEEARERAHGPQEEMALYVVHGFLHLNGYTDADPVDRERMHAVQEPIWKRCLEKTGAPSGGAR